MLPHVPHQDTDRRTDGQEATRRAPAYRTARHRKLSRSPQKTTPRTHGRHGNRDRLAIVGVVLLLFVLTVAVFATYRYVRIANKIKPVGSADRTAVEEALDPVEDLPRDVPIYILILGADARPGQTRARSDTIILARVDRTEKSVLMLSIPRDSRVPVAGHGLDKIAHANAYGGPALAIATVKNYTGLPVNHFVELDFEGFASIVDAVGGVVVTVDQEINDANGSNTGGVSSVTHIAAGRQRLNAEQALTFVRSRAYARGDFTRIKNQQKFLIALATQSLQPKNLGRLPSIAEAAAENIQTDMTIPELLSIASSLRGMSENATRGITVPGGTGTINGVSYVIPDEAKARTLFEQFRAGTISE